MRIIRTEMYFAEIVAVGQHIKQEARQNPGVGVAFLKLSEYQILAPVITPNELLANVIDIASASDQRVRQFIDLSLRGLEDSFRYQTSKFLVEPIRNPEAVDYVLAANIVIEQSPPDWALLKDLIKKSPGVAIGTYIGMQAAGQYPQLMYITVPAGIMVVSSAIGISKALAKGLNKKVEALLTSRNRRIRGR
jgi:hypothetical protein